MDVVLNRIGLDHVSMNISESGSSVSSVTLDELLLDPTKDYVMRVTELNAPISAIPLFGFDSAGKLLNLELFRIKHRFPGFTFQAFEVDAAHVFETSQNAVTRALKTKGKGNRIHYAAANFITELGLYANTFTQTINEIGITYPAAGGVGALNGAVILAPNSHEDMLTIRLNADGCVEFVGTPVFWDNFVIQFSTFGKVLFGVHDYLDANRVMAVTTTNTGALDYTMMEAGYIIYPSAQNQNYQVMLNTTKIAGSYPLFRNLDHRYCITVETDLMVLHNIKVIDGKQTVDRSICKVYFPTECKVLLQSENGVLKQDIDFQIPTRIGQHSFIKKTNPSKQWSSLQTSYDIRFYRFHLYVTYRRYIEADDKFYFVQLKYPIQEEDNWDMSVEFVSKL